MPVSPLTPSDLIASTATPQILMPSSIPIYPKLYAAKFAYTPEFVDEVKRAVPDAMREDIGEIERILSRSLPHTFTDEEIHVGGESDFSLSLRSLRFQANPEDRSVGLDYVGSNIGIAPHLAQVFTVYDAFREIYLVPPEKIKEYAISPGQNPPKLHVWHRHNLGLLSTAGRLYFRNFARMFNNVGIRNL